MSPTLDDARAALRRHWKHPDFRPGQAEAVEAVLAGRDLLAVLPTGGGKSVLYQVPAVVKGGLTVVVSPLIALMEDQVAALNARGIPATMLSGRLPYHEVEQRWTDAEFGRYRLLYLAPERLDTDLFRARADRLKAVLLAVDEAHCISEWGPDFRPSYRRIAEGAEALGRPPVIAVTATATPEVRADIAEQLGLREPSVLVRGFDRPNLIPSVFVTSNKEERVRAVLDAVPGSGVLYANTRAGAERWARRLASMGATAEAYHAGMRAADRLAVQQRWQDDTTRVIAATNAFGMGIDKPDVRFVIHVDVPPSVEAFYQEAGRAGRDGQTGYTALIVAESDVEAARAFLDQGRPEPETVQAIYDTALSLAQVAVGSAAEDPFVVDPARVAGLVGCAPMAVRAACEALAQSGHWQEVRLGRDRGLVRFLQSADAFRRFADGTGRAALASFTRELLRAVHADAFRTWTDMDLRALEKRTGLTRERLLRGLDFLAARELLAYHAPGDALRYRMPEARAARVPLDRRALAASRRRAEQRLAQVLRFVFGLGCRRRFLLGYFGEAAPERCGRCDVCLGRHRPATVTPEDEPMLERLLEEVRDGLPPEAWLATSGLPVHRRVGLADWLVNEGMLRVEEPLEGRYALTERGARHVRGHVRG